MASARGVARPPARRFLPRSAFAVRRRQRGFSLLELLVVVALLGLLATLTLPNLQRIYASAQRSTERDLILKQLGALPRLALLQRRDYVVHSTGATADSSSEDPPSHAEPYPLDVPEGWRLVFDKPLVVRASGVCLGAELTLSHPDAAAVRAHLQPPYCAVADVRRLAGG